MESRKLIAEVVNITDPRTGTVEFKCKTADLKAHTVFSNYLLTIIKPYCVRNKKTPSVLVAYDSKFISHKNQSYISAIEDNLEKVGIQVVLKNDRKDLEDQLRSADIVLPIITPDFVQDTNLPLKRSIIAFARSNGEKVIPLLLDVDNVNLSEQAPILSELWKISFIGMDYFEQMFQLIESIFNINSRDKEFKNKIQTFFKILKKLENESQSTQEITPIKEIPLTPPQASYSQPNVLFSQPKPSPVSTQVPTDFPAVGSEEYLHLINRFLGLEKWSIVNVTPFAMRDYPTYKFVIDKQNLGSSFRRSAPYCNYDQRESDVRLIVNYLKEKCELLFSQNEGLQNKLRKRECPKDIVVAVNERSDPQSFEIANRFNDPTSPYSDIKLFNTLLTDFYEQELQQKRDSLHLGKK